MPSAFERIAKRVFLAFTYRKKTIESQFGFDGADKGIVIFSFRYYPLMWAYPKNGNVNFVYTLKEDEAWNLFCGGITFGEIGEYAMRWFRYHTGSLKIANFRKLLFNNICCNNLSQVSEQCRIIGRKETKTLEEAKKILTTNYDISLVDFYKIFGGEGSVENKFSCNGMDFEMNDSSFTKEQMEGFMNDVKQKLPSSLADELMYGSVELKKKFSKNANADYNHANDSIRMDESSDFVRTIIHELGHRWHYKFCTPVQEKALTRLYALCKSKEKDIGNIHKDDWLQYANGKDYIVVEETDEWLEFCLNGSVPLKKYRMSKKDMSKYGTIGLVTINGLPPSDFYNLPSLYAGRNIKEFISCCFEYVYGGLNVNENLKEKFKEIVEG